MRVQTQRLLQTILSYNTERGLQQGEVHYEAGILDICPVCNPRESGELLLVPAR